MTLDRAKSALITGITGQDGMYLAEFLLAKGYRVHGLIRGHNNPRRQVLEAELPAVHLIEGDLTDTGSLAAALERSRPDEVYNLAALSFVGGSFAVAETTANITGLGALRLLEAIRLKDGDARNIRFYQASTSEIYGRASDAPQTELTPFCPRTPYGVAKAYAHHTTVNYRESYGLHASCGILFNHESPRRGHEFITRKITRAVARIDLGIDDHVTLGNLDSRRDWGFAGDYVKGMWMMLQQDKPDDYILATGRTHSIGQLLDVAFGEVGIDDWQPYVRQDRRFMRPAEVDWMMGDAGKAKRELGWSPEVGFHELITMMVKNDLEVEGSTMERARVLT